MGGKCLQVPNFTKIRPVRAELSHADRQTDRWTNVTKLMVAFRNFAKSVLKNGTISSIRVDSKDGTGLEGISCDPAKL